jgi:hypothetical protein
MNRYQQIYELNINGNAPILELVPKAEQEMYEGKEQYHKVTGYYR